jgi:1,2-diacylglycerol 3-alpha-glucosyltransferase
LAFLAARAKHTPLVYTYHTAITDYVHYLMFAGNTRPARKAARWFSTKTANLSDRVITPSAKIRDLLIKEHVTRPIHTIPNGIDLKAFHDSAPSNACHQQLGLGPEARLLLSVGRLAPEKNLDLLLDAFAHLAVRLPDAHLVFAGDGSSRAGLEKQAAGCGYSERIHFLGMVDQASLPGLLHEADLFLSASTTETQCIAMVEAIAAGLPVVALWDEAFNGMLVEGLNGLCAPRDPAAFADAVCTLLADPERLRAFGRKSVELSRKFSIEAQTAALVDLYRETILEKTALQRKRISFPYALPRSTF